MTKFICGREVSITFAQTTPKSDWASLKLTQAEKDAWFENRKEDKGRDFLYEHHYIGGCTGTITHLPTGRKFRYHGCGNTEVLPNGEEVAVKNSRINREIDEYWDSLTPDYW